MSPWSSARTARASRTWSTRSRGCSARRDRARLRGGKMDDVIFAGTTARPSLGRAEVSLTIDNTAALLPIEFTEVTITRHAVPHRRVRVPAQRRALPPARRAGAAVRRRCRPPAARDRRPGPARHRAQLFTGRPARHHRRGRRDPEVPPPQGTRRAPPRPPPRATCCASATCCARSGASSGRCNARPMRHAATARWSKSSARSSCTSPVTRSPGSRRASSGCATSGSSSWTRAVRVRDRLRVLDEAVHRGRASARRARCRRARATSWCARSRCGNGRAGLPRSSTRSVAASSGSWPPRPTKVWSRRSSPTRSRCAPSSTKLDAEPRT